MGTTDAIILIVALALALLGFLVGFASTLRFFTHGVFGWIISVFMCATLGDMVQGAAPVQNWLTELNASMGGFLQTIHAATIIFYFVFFLVLQLVRVLVVRLLARTTPRAVHLYGLFTGGALALVSLPATLCCGFVAAAVPAVSAAGSGKAGAERALTALAFTFAIALPCAAGIFLFAPVIAGLLYPALSAQDAAVLVRLLRLMCVSSAALAAVDTLAACLTAMGRAKCAMRAMLCAVLCKAALQLLLVGKLGITGAAIAANGCYLVAFFLDLFYTVDTVKADRREKRHVVHHRTRNQEGGSDAGRACGASKSGRRRRAHRNAPLGGKLEGGGDRLPFSVTGQPGSAVANTMKVLHQRPSPIRKCSCQGRPFMRQNHFYEGKNNSWLSSSTRTCSPMPFS